MADLRALMRERKAASKRIEHPYARYSNSGQLSCSLCSLPVKNEVLWPSHLTSKVHRQNVRQQQLADAEQGQQEQPVEAVVGSKRAAEGEPDLDGGEAQAQAQAKRVRWEDQVDGSEETNDVAAPAAGPTASSSFLPPGFFDDPNQALSADTTEDQEATDDMPADDEWAQFEATLSAPVVPEASTSAGPVAGYSAAATISGEEKLFEDPTQDGEEGDDNDAGNDEEGDEAELKETEAERREREEREELMERIETEEREQRDADERVDALKKRLLSVRASKKSKPATKANGQGSVAENTGSETARERRRRRLGR